MIIRNLNRLNLNYLINIFVKNFSLDGYKLENLLVENCEYHHDFNGTGNAEIAMYDNYLGWNGKVIFKFTSPAYVWILKKW